METNASVKAIANICKKVRIAAVVLFCFCIPAVAALAVKIISAARDMSLAPEELEKKGLTGSALSGDLSKGIARLLFFVICAAAFMICIRLFGRILADGTPFREGTASSLKKISLLLLVSAVVPSFVGFIFYALTLPVPLSELSYKTVIEESGLTVMLAPLFLSGFMFAMTAVFRYGCLLQQESDETL